MEFWNNGYVLDVEAHRSVTYDAAEPYKPIALTQTYDVEAVGESTFGHFGRDPGPAHGDS